MFYVFRHAIVKFRIQKIPLSYLLIGLLIALNSIYFLFKNTQILTSVNQRNFEVADQFIKKNIPKNSKVIGEPMYYYSVLKAGSNYQYMDLYNTLEKREQLLREVYDFEYMIVTEHISWRKPHIPNYFMSQSKFKIIDSLIIPESKISSWFTHSLIGKFVSQVERTGYNCKIYKVIKN